MLIGYARVSILDQEASFDAQLRELTALAAERMVRKQVSLVSPRPQMEAAIEFCHAGDSQGM